MLQLVGKQRKTHNGPCKKVVKYNTLCTTDNVRSIGTLCLVFVFLQQNNQENKNNYNMHVFIIPIPYSKYNIKLKCRIRATQAAAILFYTFHY